MRLSPFTNTLLAGAAGLAIATVTLAGQQTKTTWDGVYSAAQAEKGAAVYSEKCAKCHAESGTGGDAPDLVGGGFAADWDTYPVNDLFERTRISMPADNAGSLSRDEVTLIVAFLLKLNEFPAGETELPAAAEALRQIKYVATRPAAGH